MVDFIILDLSFSDYLDIFSLIINSFLAIWIVYIIQNNLNNKRILKDHFINEIKELRKEYKNFLNSLYLGKLKPKEVIPWFKLMNIKSKNLLFLLNKKYKVDKNALHPYQIHLRKIVTEFSEFDENFKTNREFKLSEESKNELIIFQQDYNGIFNSLIMDINDK